MKFLKKIIFGLLFTAAVTISFQQEARASEEIDGFTLGDTQFPSADDRMAVSNTLGTPSADKTYTLYAYAGTYTYCKEIIEYSYDSSTDAWSYWSTSGSGTHAKGSYSDGFGKVEATTLLTNYVSSNSCSGTGIPLGFFIKDSSDNVVAETHCSVTAVVTPQFDSDISDIEFTVSPTVGTIVYSVSSIATKKWCDTVSYTVSSPSTILTGNHINADRTSSTYKYWDASNVSGTPTETSITVSCPSDGALVTPKYYYNYDNVTGVTVSSSPSIESYSGYDGILVTGTKYTLTPSVASASSSWTSSEAKITSSDVTVTSSGSSYSFTVPTSYSGSTVSLTVAVANGTYTKGTGASNYTKTLTYYVQPAVNMTGIKFTATSPVEIKVGETKTINVYPNPENATDFDSSKVYNPVISDTTHATAVLGTAASKYGTVKVTGVKEGSVTLTASYNGTSYKTSALNITIKPSAEIDVDDQIVINEGITIPLSNFASVSPTTTALKYTFSPTGYASASGTTISKASLTGNSSGQTTLTVYDSDDATIKDSGTVKVYPKSSVSISSGTAELTVPTAANTGSNSTYITKTTGMLISADTGSKTYYYNGSEWTTSRTAYSVSSSSGYSVSTTLSSSTMKALGSKIKSDGISTSSVTLSVAPYGNTASGTDNYNNDVSASKTINLYKITLDSSSGAGYTVDGSTTSDYFYAINGLTYTVDSYAKNSGYKFSEWSGGESSTATISSFSPSSSRTLKAVYVSSTVAGSSATGSSSLNSSGSLSGYDKVPKTGESWSDILILCGILLASATGAAIIIYKQISHKKAFARKSVSLRIPDGENKGGTK